MSQRLPSTSSSPHLSLHLSRLTGGQFRGPARPDVRESNGPPSASPVARLESARRVRPSGTNASDICVSLRASVEKASSFDFANFAAAHSSGFRFNELEKKQTEAGRAKIMGRFLSEISRCGLRNEKFKSNQTLLASPGQE